MQDAWIGDAVLCLYARLKVLREDGRVDAERCARLTSNRFLSAIGEPTEVEAELGRVYARGGLEAAFESIEARLVPVFEKQESKRPRQEARARARARSEKVAGTKFPGSGTGFGGGVLSPGRSGSGPGSGSGRIVL